MGLVTGTVDSVADLKRFVDSQDAEGTYERALAELRAGHKTSHWMWFVFPQIAGLGASPMAQRYAIESIEEARAYLDHPVLGPRLRDAAAALTAHPGDDAEPILGAVDAMKLRSSMTLFSLAAPQEPVFTDVLAQYFRGELDPATTRRV